MSRKVNINIDGGDVVFIIVILAVTAVFITALVTQAP